MLPVIPVLYRNQICVVVFFIVFSPFFFSKTTTTGAKMLRGTGENFWLANTVFGHMSGTRLLVRLAVLCLLYFFPH